MTNRDAFWIHAAVNYGWHKSSGHRFRAHIWGAVADALARVN